MKYLYHSLVLMLALVVSCEKQRVNPEFSKRTDIIIRQNVPGYVMSKDEVAEYASKLACVFNETKAAIKAVKSISPVTDVWKFDMEDSLSQDERSLLSVIYVVNYENNGGFAIICADNRTEQVLAFSDCGNLDFSSKNTKSGIYSNDGDYTIYDIIDLLPYYVQGLSRYVIDYPENLSDIDSLDANGYYYANPSYYYSDWITIEEEIVPTARWGQSMPYNYYCPVEYDYNTQSFERDLVGCNAIAIGEVMYNYAYPDSLNALYCATIGSKVCIPWQPYFSTVDNNSKVIADLLRQIADDLPTHFGLEASSAYFSSIPSTLETFNYSCNSIQTYSFDRIVQGIITYVTPVITYGVDLMDESAHTWVIDGYRRNVKYWLCDWDVYGPDGLYKGRWTSMTDNLVSANYVHCNWGWDGLYNGYYSTLLFNPGNSNYSYDCHIITNIKPLN